MKITTEVDGLKYSYEMEGGEARASNLIMTDELIEIVSKGSTRQALIFATHARAVMLNALLHHRKAILNEIQDAADAEEGPQPIDLDD